MFDWLYWDVGLCLRKFFMRLNLVNLLTGTPSIARKGNIHHLHMIAFYCMWIKSNETFGTVRILPYVHMTYCHLKPIFEVHNSFWNLTRAYSFTGCRRLICGSVSAIYKKGCTHVCLSMASTYSAISVLLSIASALLQWCQQFCSEWRREHTFQWIIDLLSIVFFDPSISLRVDEGILGWRKRLCTGINWAFQVIHIRGNPNNVSFRHNRWRCRTCKHHWESHKYFDSQTICQMNFVCRYMNVSLYSNWTINSLFDCSNTFLWCPRYLLRCT